MMRYLVFLVFVVLGCKKDVAEPDTKAMLISSKWQLTGLYLESPIGAMREDITIGTYKPCELDDEIEFRSNGVFFANEGDSVCFPSNNSTLYNLSGGQWELSNNDSLLTVRAGFALHSFYFYVKSNDYMELYREQKNYFDEKVRYIYIFEAMK